MAPLIAPSLLSADFLNLSKEIEMVNQSEADWLHLDIMDGVFVPNITFGMPVVAAIAQKAAKPLDVHLMIVQPERYIQAFHEAGASVLSIHVEGAIHLHRSLEQIRKFGMKAGVVLNPHSPVMLLEDIVSYADLVLIMAVNPGFGGQRFIEGSIEKIRQVKELTLRKNPACLIEVDGGVTLENAPILYQAGVDVLVAGKAVFGHPDPASAIRQLKRYIEKP